MIKEQPQPTRATNEIARDEAGLPKRKRFGEGLLEEMAKKDFSREKRATAAELEQAFGDYVANHDDAALREIDPQATQEMMDAVAEAVVETAYILGLSDTIPELGFYSDPEKDDEGNVAWRGTHGETELGSGLGRVEINVEFLKECIDLIKTEPSRSPILMRDLQEGVAHEMYHEYAAKHYPLSDERSLNASLAGGEAYEKDKVENAADLFAEGYIRLKKALARKAAGLDYS